ncbi:MAG: RDD family protein [Proteobacteria bacterium]|nr:RDD family protein [Pseudomonadota bacterium]
MPASERLDVAPASVSASATPAHLGWRLLAMVYDLLPLVAIWFVVATVDYLARGMHEVRPGSIAAWFELALLWLATGAYFVVSWRRGGHTVGMRAWRLKVLATDGRPASWSRLCLRYTVATLSLAAAGLGLIWSLVDGQRRSWHDLAADTVFVRMDHGG